MRDTMLLSAALLLLVSEAWSRETETNHSSTHVNTSTSVVRNVSFNMGSDVNLSCSNVTWDQLMFVIWKVPYNHTGQCTIALSKNRAATDQCGDGRSLRNTSASHVDLHIHNFSRAHVGVYRCELVFAGGAIDCKISVDLIVPPNVSAWLEGWDRTVAVCRAEGGAPAANISWSRGGAAALVETRGADGSVTVESRLELGERADAQNLTCAVSHPFWEQRRILVPEPRGNFTWLLFLVAALVSLLLLAVALLVHRKLMIVRRCHESPSKSAPIEDVEEVEPYASYIQRVNSIYN